MKYSFEKETYRKIDIEGNKSRIVFENRLGLKQSFTDANVLGKVTRLLTVYVGNIDWYIQGITRERKLQKKYLIFTIFLILFIPIAILLVSKWVSNIPGLEDATENHPIEYFSSLLIAVLSSIIGIHRVFSAWLAKRKLLGIFHQAAADLKAKFYAFEDEWNNRSDEVFQPKPNHTQLSGLFDQALELLITEGRLIANAERKQYFEHIQNPEIDLGNILTNSFTTATSVFKNFQSKRFTSKLQEIEQEAKAEADHKIWRREVLTLDKQLKLYEEWLQEVKDLLKSHPKDVTLEARKKSIEDEIQTTKSALIKKKAQL